MSCPVGCIAFIAECLHSIIRGSKGKGGLRGEILLPDEIVSEILIRLPVKSILRFKCVCKHWLTITEDPAFVHEHMMRTTERIWASGIQHPMRSMFRGLILEYSYFSPSHYRLRNPTTRRFLRLPPSDDKYEYDHLMLPWYVSETRTFKIAFPSPNGNGGSGCFKILHASVDGTWRTIDFPFTTCKLRKITHNQVGVIGGVYITLLFPRTYEYEEPTLVCLEMESEKIWRCNIPEIFCGYRFCNKIIDWDGKPSLSVNDKGLLHVMVLEDYKSGKWADNVIVIDLNPVDGYRMFYVDCYLKDNELHILDHDNATIVFDIIAKAAARIDTPKTREHRFKGQPSLVEFEGMQSYVVTAKPPKLSLFEKFKDYVLISEKFPELFM